MKPWQLRIWYAVIERDEGLCCDCGKAASEIHHIVHRATPGAWDERNMLSLCVKHHRLEDMGIGAHCRAKRKEHIKYLRDRFEYDYDDLGDEWQGLIRESDDEAVNL